MTTASTAFSVLPIMAYLVGSVIVAYIAIRAYRHVRHRWDQSIALPRPVYEQPSKKSTFSFARKNGGDWHMWKQPFPWTRSPDRSSFKSKAASVASSKELTVALLPTTAFPPPPSSIPTSPPLVDLSTPAALETGSQFSISLPSSPKAQSRLLSQQRPLSPHSLKGHRNIQHPAYPRPPSPHALLATTPPHRHTRSRSLGGVPVRRLSGGPSGLRNKVDVELHDIASGHARGSSEEHLLIDFSSSSDDQVLGSTIHPKTAVCVLPLVDVADDRKPEPNDTAWMWPNSNTPSTIRSYDARILAPRPRASPFMGDRKFPFPLPLTFSTPEKLIDIPSGEDVCLELGSLDSSVTLVEVENGLVGKQDQSPVVVDPFSDDYAVDYIPHSSQTLVDVHGDGDQVQDEQDSRPLIADVADKNTLSGNDHNPPFAYPPLVDVDDIHVEAGLMFADSQSLSLPLKAGENSPLVSTGVSMHSTLISPTVSPVSAIGHPNSSSATGPSSEAADWQWVETSDPWGDHVPLHGETLTPNTTAVDSHLEFLTQDHQGKRGFMESTPAGSLQATVLDGEVTDDDVPHLSLDDSDPTEELRLPQGQLDDEDATPKPTPLSINIQLPGSGDGASYLVISEDTTDDMAHDIQETTQRFEQAFIADTYPDPDFLPLPEFNVPSSTLEVMRASNKNSEDESIKVEPRPSSQMPTPPASPPPPFSPAQLHQMKAGKSLSSSPMVRPKNLSVFGLVARSRSRSSSPQAVQSTLPPVAKHDDVPVSAEPTLLAADPTKIPLVEQSEKEVGKTSDEAMEQNEVEETPTSETSDSEDETSLPGSLPDISPTSPLATSTLTVASRLSEKSRSTPFHPSVHAIVRQPLEIALAMQLRPGLGAGADPAWMVRFLMAMFGWFAVLVSGQENY